MSLRRVFRAAATVGLVAGVGGVARAAPSEADTLFSEGDALLRGGDAAHACPKLEKSQALDPAAGTQYRLAECYVATARYREAARNFRDLERTMRTVGDAARAQKAGTLAAAAEAKLAKVTFRIAWAKPEEVGVTCDGTKLTATELTAPVLLDPGSHSAVVIAAGHEEGHVAFSSEAGRSQDVVLDEPPRTPTPAAPITLQPVRSESTGGTQRTAGLVTGAVGIAALAGGVVIGVIAKGNYDKAKTNAGCSPDGSACPAGPATMANDARNLGTVGTVVGGVGIGLAVVGAVVWLTAPKGGPASETQARIAPVLWGDGGGIAAGGSF